MNRVPEWAAFRPYAALALLWHVLAVNGPQS